MTSGGKSGRIIQPSIRTRSRPAFHSFAAVAQWQSISLVMRRLWVRFPPAAPQKRASAKQMPFFVAKHYNLDISNFRFAILRSCPTALLGRAAFAAYERFAGGKTSAEGWLCHLEHLNHRRAERALGPRSPKRKTRYKRVFLFGAAGGNRTHNLLITSEMLCH